MHIFQYLQENLAQAEKVLSETAANYATWPQDRVFEESKKGIGLVKGYFEKEAVLLNSLKESDARQDVLAEAASMKESINTKIDNLVMIHIDEPGFEQGLEDITAQVQSYQEFCTRTLFPNISNHISPELLASLSKEIKDEVFSQVAHINEGVPRR